MKSAEQLQGLVLRADKARRAARSLCQQILREFLGKPVPKIYADLAKRCEDIGYGNKVPIFTELT
jgi:hypothetical protein